MITSTPGYQQSSFMESLDAVEALAKTTLIQGQLIDSRYGQCYEILGGRLVFPSGSLVSRKSINYSLGWMEFLQLIAGVYDPEGLKRVAPYANHDLFTEQMAYGPRIQYQMNDIIHALEEDPFTRQAVAFIGHPSDGPTSDLPCTLTIQFLSRANGLNAIVSMRSWDLCRGLPYDLMMFTGLLEVVANCIGIPAANVIVHAGSTHVYLDQVEKIPHLSKRKWRFTDGHPNHWEEFEDWAAHNIPILVQGGIPSQMEYR